MQKNYFEDLVSGTQMKIECFCYLPGLTLFKPNLFHNDVKVKQLMFFKLLHILFQKLVIKCCLPVLKHSIKFLSKEYF